MNDDILGLLGVDVKGAKEKAFARGLLSTIFNAAALSGQRPSPVSNVQALGQLGLGAMEAYDTSFDKTLKEALTGMQVKDMLAKRQQEATQRQAIQNFISNLPEDQRAKFSAFPTQAADAMFRDQPETFTQLSADEAKAKGLPPGNYQISNKTGKLSTIGGGGVSVYNYPPGSLPPGKEASNQLDEMLMSSGRRAQTFAQIQSSFRPEYLAIPFRGQQAWSTLKDKFVGLPEDQKKILGEYSAFRQNAVDNLNRTIKEITGAAMAESEAQRIIAGLPNAGTGVFDGDSPTEFQAKLENSVKQVKLVEARAVYMKKNGLSLKDVSLSSMPQIINDRAKQIAKQQGLDVNKPEDQMRIKIQLSSEFGITNQ